MLIKGLDELGFQDATPIQAEAIPLIIKGQDISGLAQTGTGKTGAFLIPLMERILRTKDLNETTPDELKSRAFDSWKAGHFVLVLVPTRELAEQVFENIDKIGGVAGLKGVSIYGGTGYEKQKEGLRNKVDFVIATPGRLIDLYKENYVDLKQVKALVFDEADRMFDMGFKDDMKYLLQRIPNQRQLMVFSATMNLDVMTTVYQFGSNPVEINISKDSARAENVKDEIFHVGQEEKPFFLLSLLNLHKPKQAIVFTNFKNNVEKIAQFLIENGLPAVPISSLLSQSQRNKVMELFKAADNQYNIMVATDVAARGLDIKGVDLVVNFELPQDSESYVHRIGRTGRAGQMGQAFSLVSDRDVESLQRIEDYLQQKIAVGFLDDSQLVKDFKPFPHFVKFNQTFGFLRSEGASQGPGTSSSRSEDRPRRDRRGRRSGPGEGHRQSGRPESRGHDRPQRRSQSAEGPRAEGGARSAGTRGPEIRGSEGRGSDKKIHHRSEGGPRHQNGAANPTTGRSSGHASGPRRPLQNQGKRPSPGGRGSAKPSRASSGQSVTQKVSQFFKKLFS